MVFRSDARPVALAATLLLLCSCREFASLEEASPDAALREDAGPDSDGGTHEPDVDAHAPSEQVPSVFTLSLASKRVEAVVGTTVTLDLSLVRASEPASDVRVDLVGLPAGVTASDLTIPATASTGVLKVSVSEAAQLARVTTVTVTTSPEASGESAQFELYVRGKPGTVDTTFGQEGAAAPGSALKYRSVVEVVALPDDKLLVLANEDIDVLGTNLTLLRINQDGSIDHDFATDGEYSFAREYGVGPPQTYGNDLLVRANGDLIVVGDWRTSSEYGPFITALTSNGRRDPEFVQPAFEGQSIMAWFGVAESQATLPNLLAVGFQMEIPVVNLFDGQVAERGQSNPYVNIINASLRFVFWDPVANKFIAGGSYEAKASISQFDYFGRTESLGGQDPLRSGPGTFEAGAVDEDGRYYFVGGSTAWELTRYLRPGLSGSEKGDFLIAKDDLGPEGDGARGLALSEQKLYVVGTNKNVAKSEMHAVLGRYSLDLERDQTFGDRGLLTLEPALSAGYWDALAVTAQSDGRLVVALINAANDLVLYRVWN